MPGKLGIFRQACRAACREEAERIGQISVPDHTAAVRFFDGSTVIRVTRNRDNRTGMPVVPLPWHGVPLSSVAMSVFGKYAQLADTCLQKAISAASVELAEGWLRMAGSWIAMAQMRQRIAARSLPQTNPMSQE